MPDPLLCPTCGTNLDQHPAGVCLDAWVGQIRNDPPIIEWRCTRDGGASYSFWGRNEAEYRSFVADTGPAYGAEVMRVECWNPYSQVIDHAWGLVETLRRDGWEVETTALPACRSNPDRDPYRVRVSDNRMPAATRRHWWFRADTPALAVCRAFIRARSEDNTK